MKIDWKPIVGKYIKVLLSAFLAGVMISIGALMYLGASAMGYKVLGAFLQGLGIILPCLYGYHLYSAKVGYVFENNALYALEVVISIIGNFIGVIGCVYLTKITRLMEDGSAFKETLTAYMVNRVDENILSVLVLSLLCGIVIYLAVNTYKKAEQPIAKFLVLFTLTAGLSLLGLEHGVSEMFIYNLYQPFNGDLTLRVMYMFIGNGVGAVIIPLLNKLRGKIKSI